MNYPYLHVLISHIPVIAVLILTILTLTAYLLKNNQMLVVSSAFMLVGFIFTAPLYYYGTLTSGSAQKFPAVTENYIQSHEDIAYSLLKVILIAFLFTTMNLFTKAKNKNLIRLNLLIYIGISVMLIQTTLSGYKIRHTESRISVFKSLEE